MSHNFSPPAGNPFATRRTRPGALPYIFAHGQTAAMLADRLARQGWRGQIVGPHGAGKSTLLCSVQQELSRQEIPLQCVTLRDGGEGTNSIWKSLAADRASAADRAVSTFDFRLPPSVVLLDGGEQLGWLAWRRLLWHCRRHRLGLVVTTHRDLGLPTLIAIQPTPAIARQVVAALLADLSPRVAAAEVDTAFHWHGGNIREALFSLYDLHESRTRATPIRQIVG